MLSYGGVNLPVPNPGLVEQIEAALPLSDLRDFCRRTFPGRLPSLGLPWLTRDWVPRLQTLCWPNTASRWAEGWFIVSDHQLGNVATGGSIRAQAYVGGNLNTLPLVINDGQRPPVTLSLFMLPPIPLAKVLPNLPAVAPGLYLLPLVDVRYFWWTKAAQIAVTAGTTTWLQLFTTLAAALGITLTVDAIPAAYLTPPGDFNTAYEFLPPQLDAACKSVGLKLVANLDGTFRAASAATGQTRLSANLALPNPTVAYGGGLIDLTSDAFSDLTGVLPASVTVLFPTVDASNNPTGGTTVQTVTLASLLPPSTVNLPQFVGAATFSGTELLRCSAGAGPANGAQITALATQIAADWYAWQGVKRAHLSLSGAATWTPAGGEERVEWYHGADTILTRVRRPAWNERDETGLLVQGAGSSGGSTFSSLTVGTLTVTGSSIDMGSETFSGSVIHTGPFEICGFQFWCCKGFTLPSGSNNDLNLPASAGPATVYDLSTPGTNSTITGIVPAQFLGANGPQIIVLRNVDAGGKTITFSNLSASSLAANRIRLSPIYGSSVTLAPGDVLGLWWDACTSSQWGFLFCSVSTLTSGSVAQSVPYTVTNVGGTVTGMTLSIPSAGTYEIWASGNVNFTTSAGLSGDRIQALLFDVTNSNPVGNTSATEILVGNTNGEYTAATFCFTSNYVAVAAATIALNANFIGTPTSPTILKSNMYFQKTG